MARLNAERIVANPEGGRARNAAAQAEERSMLDVLRQDALLFTEPFEAGRSRSRRTR
jgi:hypothetical protein